MHRTASSCRLLTSDKLLTPTIQPHMCVCFQTMGKLGFGAALFFSVKEMKHKSIQVQLSFMSCEQSECFW